MCVTVKVDGRLDRYIIELQVVDSLYNVRGVSKTRKKGGEDQLDFSDNGFRKLGETCKL